ncbi:hypothetical protein PHPALM_30866 [Phytophthora palmivora]|uniref:Uncharacterized protein n=1 Tax=Phytophthora palmivora TaxID=4796 RepID=A0A2P4X425_9STRA|nr:hypothetical protein PHPALM_30866 [Phytophthora palmivora]
MEDVQQVEPKKVIGYLVEAPRHPAFKDAIHSGVRSTKSFLKWVRTELEGFMRFEAHISGIQHENYNEVGPRAGIVRQIATETWVAPNCSKTRINYDPTHGVFQCPDITAPTESKELNENSTGTKVIKPVVATTPAAGGRATSSSPGIPCVTMDAILAAITSDSGAESLW